MTPHLLELGRRAVACKGWRWMPGMRYVLPSGYAHRIDEDTLASGVIIGASCTPDLSDPATLGCLLALVREAWRDPGISVMAVTTLRHPSLTELHVSMWEICGLEGLRGGVMSHSLHERKTTEAEALVVALESAP